MRKILTISLFAASTTLLVTPATACDSHGAGGFHGAFGSKWAPYTPSNYSDEYTPAEDFPSPQRTVKAKQKKKPTFSNFARLASVSAKSKVSEKPTFSNFARLASVSAKSKVFEAPSEDTPEIVSDENAPQPSFYTTAAVSKSN